MVLVGGSVAVSGVLVDAPLLLAAGAALRGGVRGCWWAWPASSAARSWPRAGRELPWLAGVAGLGLVLFNVALVRGSEHAEPAVIGVAVACVPLVLALLGPLLEGRPPQPGLLLAAAVVTAGVVCVQGGGAAPNPSGWDGRPSCSCARPGSR